MRDDAPVRRNLKDAFDASAAAAAQVAAGPQAVVPHGAAAVHGPVGHLQVGLPVQVAPVGDASVPVGHPGLPAPVWRAARAPVHPPGQVAPVGGSSTAVGHTGHREVVGNVGSAASAGGASGAVEDAGLSAPVFVGGAAAAPQQLSDPVAPFAASVNMGVIDPTRPTRVISRWREWQRSPVVEVYPPPWAGWDMHLQDVGLPLDFAEGYVGFFGDAKTGETGFDGMDGYLNYPLFQQGFESVQSGYFSGGAGGNTAHVGDELPISSSQAGEIARSSSDAENAEAGVLKTPQFPTDKSADGVNDDSDLPRSSTSPVCVEKTLNGTEADGPTTSVLESEDGKNDRSEEPKSVAAVAGSGLISADESGPGTSSEPKAAPIDIGLASDGESGTEQRAGLLPLAVDGAIGAAVAAVRREMVPVAKNGEEGNERPEALAMAGALVPYLRLVAPGQIRAVAVRARNGGGRVMKLRSSYKYVLLCGFRNAQAGAYVFCAL